MNSLHIRRAGPMDGRALAELLNEIIAIGGTTAIVNPVTGNDMVEKMGRADAVFHLAEDDSGTVMGFQYLVTSPDIPEHAIEIATFARVGRTGLGIGSKLFEATRKAAKSMGYTMIDAIIRADNEGGLAYYQSRGFETIRTIRDYKMANGQIVDKVWKRYKID